MILAEMLVMKNTDKSQIEHYLTRFFTAHQCTMTQEDGVLSVQLTVEMDKALMNRPFYWQYIEATGNVGEPKKLHFITDPTKMEKKGEWIHFGSPRLQQIYHYLRKTARFIHLYENLHVTKNTMLQPWLLLNICITYEGKQKKEELFSIGLNLINGSFVFDMMEKLATVDLKPVIPNHCYTISPLIKVTSGLLRIESYLDHYVMEQEHEWAMESIQLLNEEIEMINHFYEGEDVVDEKEKEIADVTKRLQPKISYEMINGGIVYLRESFIKSIS